MILASAVFHYLALAAFVVPATRAATFDVVVGGAGGLKYEPESVTAVAGDQIRFIFKAKHHTATQSSFSSPCTPLAGGFDSGFVPVPDDSPGVVGTYNVTSADPVWVFCKQGQHCRNAMVFAVNPGNRMEAFKAAASGDSTPASYPTTPSPSPATSSPSPTTPSSTYSPPASFPTPASGKEHIIIVGGTELAFTPPNIQARPGDTIVFEFRAKNHTVTASSFDAPCLPLAVNGWTSGFVPVAADVTADFPQYRLTVNDSKPIWAHCAQGNHCGQGMVFSANAAEQGPKNYQAFRNIAQQTNGTLDEGGSDEDYDGAPASRSATSLVVAISSLLVSTFMM